MTPSELKYHIEQTQGEHHFFTRDTMKFWGDTMRNFGVHDYITHWKLYRKQATFSRAGRKSMDAGSFYMFRKADFTRDYEEERKLWTHNV